MSKAEGKRAALPKTIRLGGRDIPVRFDGTTTGLEGCYGLARYNDGDILISPTASVDQQWATFWHEVLHWILFLCGRDEARQDECFITSVAEYLNQVHRQVKPRK